MISSETELEMVRRHVREAEARLARQQDIIARPTEQTEHARQMLVRLEIALSSHRAHLERLIARN